MAQNLKQIKKLGLALAVTAVTGGLTTGVWAVNNVAGTGNGVALGNESRATSVTGRTSIAIGDAAAAAYRDSIAIGNGANAARNGAIAIGYDAKMIGENAIAIGTSAKTGQDNNVAIGTGAEAMGTEDVAIGRGAKANGYSVVLGSGSQALEEKSVAIGKNVMVENPQGIAIGSDITASGKSSIAIGDKANTTKAGEVSVAMGALAQATVKGGVALGWESLADRASGIFGYDPLTDSASTSRTAKWRGLSGAISVGDSTQSLTRQIINVAAGSEDTDAVNVAQLKAARVKLEKGSNISSIDADTTGGFTKYTINAVDTIVKDSSASYKEDGTGTITLNTESNGTAGTVTVSGLQDKYINGATLANNKLTITRNDGKPYEIDGIATTADVANISDKLSQGFKIKGGSNDVDGATIALDGDTAPAISFDVKEADKGLTVERDGNAIKYGINASKLAETLGVNSDNLNKTFAKNDASNLTPENVTSWKKTLGITGDELSQAGAWTIQGGGADKATIGGAKKVNFVGGSFTTVDVTATADGAAVSIGLDETATKAIENVNKFIKTDESGNAKLNIVGDDKTGVKVEAQDDGSTKVSLADQAKVGQVAIDGKDGKGEITGLTNTTWTPESIVENRAATEGQLQGLAQDIAGDISDLNKAIKNNGKDLNTEKATIGGNTTIDKEGIIVNNPNGEGSTKITGDSISTGTVNTDKVVVGGDTYISDQGLNANNKTITGVAPGVNGTDAVNMNQLNEVAQGVNNVGSAVNRLSNRVDKVAAGSAALAALHPLDFDSDDKLSFAVGFGGYKGEHAAAFGAFYRANDDLMFSLGATVGNSNDQYNAGVSFRFGESSPYTNMSKADMAAKLETQDKNMAVLQADNEELKARLAKLEALVTAK